MIPIGTDERAESNPRLLARSAASTRTVSCVVRIAGNRAAPSRSRSTAREPPGQVSVTRRGSRAAVSASVATCSRVIVRWSIQFRASAGRASSGSAVQVVRGSPSTAARTEPRASGVPVDEATTLTGWSRNTRRASASPGRRPTSIRIAYGAARRNSRERAKPASSSGATSRPVTQRMSPRTRAHPCRASSTARSTIASGLPHADGTAGSRSLRVTAMPDTATSASSVRLPTRPESSSTRSTRVGAPSRATVRLPPASITTGSVTAVSVRTRTTCRPSGPAVSWTLRSPRGRSSRSCHQAGSSVRKLARQNVSARPSTAA